MVRFLADRISKQIFCSERVHDKRHHSKRYKEERGGLTANIYSCNIPAENCTELAADKNSWRALIREGVEALNPNAVRFVTLGPDGKKVTPWCDQLDVL